MQNVEYLLEVGLELPPLLFLLVLLGIEVVPVYRGLDSERFLLDALQEGIFYHNSKLFALTVNRWQLRDYCEEYLQGVFDPLVKFE